MRTDLAQTLVVRLSLDVSNSFSAVLISCSVAASD